MRAHPLEAVQALRKVARRKERAAIYFKVFVGQWTRPLDEVVSGLAAEPGFVPVLLQRRSIDVYVSYRKAEAAGQYKHVDTTDQPVRLDAAAYARWAETARGWYRGVARALEQAGTPPLRASYERDIDMPADALSAHWSALLGLPAPAAIDPALALPRQDRSERLEDKIANAAEFIAGLEQRGLWEESQRGFLDAPGPAPRPSLS
jgi:hypothetical protein